MNKEYLDNKNVDSKANAGCPSPVADSSGTSVIKEVAEGDYKYGFVSDIDTCLLYTSPSPRDM